MRSFLVPCVLSVVLSSCAFAMADDNQSEAKPLRTIAIVSVATGGDEVSTSLFPNGVPSIKEEPLPYTMEDIRGLSELAQVQALRENEKVRHQNKVKRDRIIGSILLQLGKDRQDARRRLANSEFGKSVLKAPDVFTQALVEEPGRYRVMARNVSAEDLPPDALFVRLVFAEPESQGAKAVVPGISNMPVKLIQKMTLLVGDASGAILYQKGVEQTMTLPNPDAAMGTKGDGLRDELVQACAKEAAALLEKM